MGFFFAFSKPRHGLTVGRGTGSFKPLGYFDEDCISIKSLPDNLPIVRELLATVVASTRKHKYEKHTKYTMRSLFTLPSASLPSGGATLAISITLVAITISSMKYPCKISFLLFFIYYNVITFGSYFSLPIVNNLIILYNDVSA